MGPHFKRRSDHLPPMKSDHITRGNQTTLPEEIGPHVPRKSDRIFRGYQTAHPEERRPYTTGSIWLYVVAYGSPVFLHQLAQSWRMLSWQRYIQQRSFCTWPYIYVHYMIYIRRYKYTHLRMHMIMSMCTYRNTHPHANSHKNKNVCSHAYMHMIAHADTHTHNRRLHKHISTTTLNRAYQCKAQFSTGSCLDHAVMLPGMRFVSTFFVMRFAM